MAESSDWLDELASRSRTYEQLCDEAVFAVRASIRDSKIKTHSITGRVKDPDSFAEKINRKSYTDPFIQMPDIVGIRIVCLFLADLSKLRAIVHKLFDVVEEDDKIDGVSDDTFGYMSHHYVCRLKRSLRGPRYDQIKGIRFEVQCRTILMDAWANVSHYLAYKGEASVPNPLKRDFYALSGLFYVADQHFQLFADAAAKADVEAESVVAKHGHGSDAPLNRSTVRALFRTYYKDREHVDEDGISDFVEQVALAGGVSTIGDLVSALDLGAKAFEVYESSVPPDVRPGNRYLDVGAARLTLALVDPTFARVAYPSPEEFDSYQHLITRR